MASQCYNAGINGIGDASINFTANTIGVMLVQSSYTMDPDHNFVSTIVASEVTAAGYSRQTLGGKTVTKDDTNNRSVFDGSDVATFGSIAAGQTIGGIVIFKNTGADATSVLIAFLDTADTPTNGSAVGATWAATGIFYGQI